MKLYNMNQAAKELGETYDKLRWAVERNRVVPIARTRGSVILSELNLSELKELFADERKGKERMMKGTDNMETR